MNVSGQSVNMSYRLNLSDSNDRDYYTFDDVQDIIPCSARNLKECGCYEVSEDVSRDRPFEYSSEWVRTYYLCKDHMIVHKEKTNLRKQALAQQELVQQQQDVIDQQNYQKWKQICELTKPIAEVEKNNLIYFMHGLKLKRLRDIPTKDSNWIPTFHRGYVYMNFIGTHFSSCPAKNVDSSIKCGWDCECFSSIKHRKFRYQREKSKYLFKYDM